MSREDDRQDQDTIEKAVVLEVNVVDDEKTRREQDGERSGVRLLLRPDRR